MQDKDAQNQTTAAKNVAKSKAAANLEATAKKPELETTQKSGAEMDSATLEKIVETLAQLQDSVSATHEMASKSMDTSRQALHAATAASQAANRRSQMDAELDKAARDAAATRSEVDNAGKEAVAEQGGFSGAIKRYWKGLAVGAAVIGVGAAATAAYRSHQAKKDEPLNLEADTPAEGEANLLS